MLKLLNFSCSRCLFPSDHSDHFLVNINIVEHERGKRRHLDMSNLDEMDELKGK